MPGILYNRVAGERPTFAVSNVDGLAVGLVVKRDDDHWDAFLQLEHGENPVPIGWAPTFGKAVNEVDRLGRMKTEIERARIRGDFGRAIG